MKKKTQLYKFLTYILKENKIPPKVDYDMDFWKYGPFQAIQKFVSFVVKVFLAIFFHICFYHILNPNKISQIKALHNFMHTYIKAHKEN
jgi:hypothetical protein